MVGCGLLMAAFAPQLVAVFNDDEDVVRVGARLLRIIALALPMMGLGATLSGTLRAGWKILLTIFRYAR